MTVTFEKIQQEEGKEEQEGNRRGSKKKRRRRRRRRRPEENCALLGHYAASSGNFLPTFRDKSGTPKMGLIGCPETSVINYHYLLSSDPEERSSQLLRGGSLRSHKIRLI
jgi:hypothetical protein